MRRLEQEAKDQAEVQRRERAEAEAQRQATGKKAGGRPPKEISDTPEEQAKKPTSRMPKLRS